MEKDYIEIRGKRYRVEVTVQALLYFLDARGKFPVEDAAAAAMRDQMLLLFFSIQCGEDLEGRECDLVLEDLFKMRRAEMVRINREFDAIYARQSDESLGEGDQSKKE